MNDLLDIATRLRAAGLPERAAQIEALGCDLAIEAPVIRECLKVGGFATTRDGAEVGGDFLVGVRGELYHVASDYQVGRSVHGYAAIGCGRDIARGALHATRGMAPRRRVRVALEAAAAHCMGVRPPWRIVARGRA